MIRVLKRGLVLFMMLLMLAGTTNVFAANIGDKIETEESGWKRIDDSDSKILYNGTWAQGVVSSAKFNNGSIFTKTLGSTCNFKFYGTKLRIIDAYDNNRESNIKINIDGAQYKYSAYQSTTGVQKTLQFESPVLTLGVHTVSITKGTSDASILCIDAIDIDNTGDLVPYDSTYLTATTSSVITLDWAKVDGATKYIVKVSKTKGSGYLPITTEDIVATSFVHKDATPGTTYYYVVVPVVNGKECTQSNEASAKIDEIVTPPPTTGNATLIITMTNGNTKQYNVDMTTANGFISWYNNRAAGSSGTPYFVINKNENLAPYNKKTEYLVFDKISSFEVDEYAQ